MRKLLAVLLAAVLMTSLFVGCGKEEEPANNTATETKEDKDAGSTETKEDTKEDAAEAKDEEVELRIVTMFGGTDPSTEAFEQQLVDFQAEYPNVTVVNESMTSVGDEYRTAVKTDYSTGNEADVVFFYNGADAAGMIEMGAVMPYEEIWETYPEVGADITDGIKEFMREEDGKLYALPMTGFYEGLFVNKEIFEAHGLELPTTWENLMTAVEVLQENGIVPFAGPVAQSHYMIEHFVLASAGVEGHQNVLDGDVPQSWVDGLNNIKALYDAGAFSEDALGMEIEASQNLFRQEKAAMILEGSWFIGGCEDELKDKMTVMPMPTAPGGAKDPSSIVSGFSTGYYVSRSSYEDSARQQAVIDLVSYLTTAESIKEIATANGGTPSAPVVVEGLPQLALDGHAMAAAASAITMPIDSRLTPEAFNYIVKEGTPFICYGERTALEVLEEVKKINGK